MKMEGININLPPEMLAKNNESVVLIQVVNWSEPVFLCVLVTWPIICNVSRNFTEIILVDSR